MTNDPLAGWDAVAGRFMAVRSAIGADLVRSWRIRCLSPRAAILDIGCGSGVPIARALANEGFTVYGIDAAPALVAAFRRHLPGMPAPARRRRTAASSSAPLPVPWRSG